MYAYPGKWSPDDYIQLQIYSDICPATSVFYLSFSQQTEAIQGSPNGVQPKDSWEPQIVHAKPRRDL